ncbi:hypothetical protein [Leptospira terpstrae]|uniref:Uncharacterized protein n=1 Tax=Leptospira terpstrae serovar Hualin str. LT 11-33 = ATCC 700639 TaxID=1257025 RepID=N1VLJ0_9LEPT|nr:hypothetical protein [Leptospira terpstrae]EMY60589.1 hypothetical protein LEP1GSC203_0371 [Leptospira terpstrae serovar Hualin str. LT 11-33 = ATCC 700639]
MNQKENFKYYAMKTKFFLYGSIFLIFITSSLSWPFKITSPKIFIIIPDEYCFYAHVGFNDPIEKIGADYFYTSHNKVQSNKKTKFEGKFDKHIKYPGFYEINSFNFPENVYFYRGKKVSSLLENLTLVGIFGTALSFIILVILSWIEINIK